MKTLDDWKKISERQCRFVDELLRRIPAVEHLPADDSAVIDLAQRFERHNARMARHSAKALRFIEPVGSA